MCHAEEKGVRCHTHPARDRGAIGRVVTTPARFAIEEGTKALPRLELALKHVGALGDSAVRARLLRMPDRTDRHRGSAECGHLKDEAGAIRCGRGHPYRACVLGHGQARDAQPSHVRDDASSGEYGAVLCDAHDRVVAAVQHVQIGTAAKSGVAGEVTSGHFRHGRRDVHGRVEQV